MINELVSSILEAEQRASEITAEASVRAQSISDEARVKAGEQLKAADVKLREDLSIETEKTKALAEEIYKGGGAAAGRQLVGYRGSLVAR